MSVHQLTPSLQNFPDKHQSEKLIFCPCGPLVRIARRRLLIFWHLDRGGNHTIREGLPKTARPHIWNSYLCLAKSLCVFGPVNQAVPMAIRGMCRGLQSFALHPPPFLTTTAQKNGDKPKWKKSAVLPVPSFLPCRFPLLTHSSHPRPGAFAAGRAGAEAVGLWEASSREPAGHDQRQQVDLWTKVKKKKNLQLISTPLWFLNNFLASFFLSYFLVL